jgi:hypothetical protein
MAAPQKQGASRLVCSSICMGAADMLLVGVAEGLESDN